MVYTNIDFLIRKIQWECLDVSSMLLIAEACRVPHALKINQLPDFAVVKVSTRRQTLTQGKLSKKRGQWTFKKMESKTKI